jgi:hypothetical protein
MKYVVFDLDETLGYFTELSIIWNCLKTVMNLHTTAQFHKLCQVFENDFFRPGIFRTMAYLRDNRDKVKVVLYTNNTGSIAWLKMILSYMENKVGAPGLFDTIVPGFDPRGPSTQMRTSYNKTYEEIKRCAKIPHDAKVIFFDDLEHPGMLDKNVTYIKVKPYVRSLSSSYIIRKLGNNITPKSHQLIHRCITNFQTQRQYKHGTTRIINNDIVQHLLFFLNGKSKKNSTKKRKGYHKKKTRKRNRDKK